MNRSSPSVHSDLTVHLSHLYPVCIWLNGIVGSRNAGGDFPGGAVVKNPPANAGDTGSSPGPGKSHMPWSS